LRAVTDNLQRLVGVLTAEVDEEKRMSCKQVALTWMEDSDVGWTDLAGWYSGCQRRGRRSFAVMCHCRPILNLKLAMACCSKHQSCSVSISS